MVELKTPASWGVPLGGKPNVMYRKEGQGLGRRSFASRLVSACDRQDAEQVTVTDKGSGTPNNPETEDTPDDRACLRNTVRGQSGSRASRRLLGGVCVCLPHVHMAPRDVHSVCGFYHSTGPWPFPEMPRAVYKQAFSAGFRVLQDAVLECSFPGHQEVARELKAAGHWLPVGVSWASCSS